MNTTTQPKTQKVISFAPIDAINGRVHRKESHFKCELTIVAISGNHFVAPITLRTYGKPGGTKYACLWINDKKYNATGSASSNGYGYDKESAACQGAINKAGIELAIPVEARGMEEVKDALRAIAAYMGYSKFMLHYAHA